MIQYHEQKIREHQQKIREHQQKLQHYQQAYQRQHHEQQLAQEAAMRQAAVNLMPQASPPNPGLFPLNAMYGGA
jgi:hypothetical protein